MSAFSPSSPEIFLHELSKAQCFDAPVWTQVMALPSLEPVGHVHLPLTFGSLWKTSTHGELLNQCVFGHIWSLPCIFLGFSLPCSDGCKRLCICAAGAGRGSAVAVPVFGGTPGGYSRDRHLAGQDISPSDQAPRRMQLRLGQWVMRLGIPRDTQSHPMHGAYRRPWQCLFMKGALFSHGNDFWIPKAFIQNEMKTTQAGEDREGSSRSPPSACIYFLLRKKIIKIIKKIKRP